MNGSFFKLPPKPFQTGLPLPLLLGGLVMHIQDTERGQCLPLPITHPLTFSLSMQPQWDGLKERSCHGLLFPFSFISPVVAPNQHLHFGTTVAIRTRRMIYTGNSCWVFPQTQCLYIIPSVGVPFILGRPRGTVSNFWNRHFTFL